MSFSLDLSTIFYNPRTIVLFVDLLLTNKFHRIIECVLFPLTRTTSSLCKALSNISSTCFTREKEDKIFHRASSRK